MPFKFSRCICIQHPDHEDASRFYRDLFGFEVIGTTDECIELDAKKFRMFLDKFIAPDKINSANLVFNKYGHIILYF